MPLTDYYTMLTYYNFVAEKEAEARRKTSKSGGSGPGRKPKAVKKSFKKGSR